MCRLFVAAISVAALVVLSAQASAQSSDTDAILKRLEAKVDALAKENAELRERVRRLEPGHRAAKAIAVAPAPAQVAVAPPQQIVPPTLLNVAAEPVVPEIKHTGGFVAGVEGMLIDPYYTGDGAPNVNAAAATFNPPFYSNYPRFPYSFTGGYRGWLGYVDGSGWGVRLRYFDYHNAATDDVSAAFQAPAGTFTLTGALTLQTYDLEATKQLLYGDWNLTAFAGVRWAIAHQRSDLTEVGIPETDLQLNYSGLGPTAGVEGEVALAPGSPWSIFYSGRGALLYGTQADNTSDLMVFYSSGYRTQNTFASTWEFNVGPQWKTPVRGVGDAFFRITADAQYWQGVGNFSPVATTWVTFPFPTALDHNDYSGGFGLIGFTAAMGIER